MAQTQVRKMVSVAVAGEGGSGGSEKEVEETVPFSLSFSPSFALSPFCSVSVGLSLFRSLSRFRSLSPLLFPCHFLPYTHAPCLSLETWLARAIAVSLRRTSRKRCCNPSSLAQPRPLQPIQSSLA